MDRFYDGVKLKVHVQYIYIHIYIYIYIKAGVESREKLPIFSVNSSLTGSRVSNFP